MLGSKSSVSGERVRITIEIPEEEKGNIIRLLQAAATNCEVVSVRRVNQARNAKKRFSLPAAEEIELPPTPILLFPRRAELLNQRAQPEAIVQQRETPFVACEFCLQAPCITTSEFKPQGRCDARITNHTKRRKDYKWYWRTLRDCGLWEHPIYTNRKQQLGCLIEDVREVMPHCVIKDVRGRWPNPPNVPYQGHRRS